MDYRVIKEGDLFLLSGRDGDIEAYNEQGYGLYTQDTRFLSRMELRIDGEKPVLLSSNTDRSYIASFRLIKEKKDEGAIELHRERFIYDGVLYERCMFTNHFPHAAEFVFSAVFDADFSDMFLVRKYRSGKVGRIEETQVTADSLTLAYRGADEISRKTIISWDAADAKTSASGEIQVPFTLASKESRSVCFYITPMIGNESKQSSSYDEGLHKLEASYEQWYGSTARVTTDSPLFDGLYRRSVQDLRMLMTDVGYGDVPVAGLPWFAVPFGRDSLITSLFMLPLNPAAVKGTLRTLAAYQGEATDPWRDEQPGKIMHEIRFGELVTTKQSPFSPYYGTVDSTPLFLVVIGEYYRWTGDLELIRELKPNILRALEWIARAEQAGEGFVSYRQEAEKGFPNQGWKDSANSMVHQSGEYATSPIALSEVQGYVYQAKISMAPLFRLLGEAETADRLEQEAEMLKSRFERSFWMEDEQYYAVALDKEQRQVHSVTSNPGHLLMSGLLQDERAKAVAERMMLNDMFNGYGIRTMSTEAAGYYPMSYHNGSVWPHDNAMILLGLSRLGYGKEAEQVITGLLNASASFEYQRLPELFCGHGAKLEGLVPYPTTCSPQAWSAGTSLVFMQAMLGLNPNALRKEITVRPSLPQGINELRADHISIGSGILSLQAVRSSGGERAVLVEILENTTGFRIVLD
ncbi:MULTISPECIES: amylo-alpha-1,6-glucosidase [unclassified Paenibacillus]|uniref:amylo-alpha-1,6-glucosidase n=1 Tax=unclassified Paenibacillus TaxID=185978 RepID=UPI002404BD60|nr:MULTISPECIES: amylo-alpha-1,6-glucosidase [unclassified Paenibacillus]MDF9843382.1 glycogen debranching enzyme [Paenibacillus sp. PastF-2]MDF9849970.1 glycogen debranching enzyme [Paenibacillus sp. PastM-2]MDF9856678.1 glycogen debranching enzyme [Paenibacillus sp. PastF-1]MDH6481948.1 glycogen debranching enzyme [Paenibacillus sp. PastH-2]MDH6509373.1 glycogen debranching enzyme [Paenibacillus sp. PastM-3]